MRGSLSNHGASTAAAQRPRRTILLALAALLLTLAGIGQGLLAAEATAAPACSDLLLLFARGSGQTISQDLDRRSESSTFFGEIRSHTPDGLDIAEYRLGQPGHGGHTYPAEDWRTWGNVISINGKYEDSVREGVLELYALLTERAVLCPTEEWIIGGFSQGGEVISATLWLLPADVRARIGFAATFGDPTLDAFGGFPCQRGWWARGNVMCFQHGILGPRVPYVPDDMKGRYGAWCDWLDPVCAMGDDIFFAHGRYPDAAIPAAAVEAVSAVRSDHDWTLRNLLLGTGTAGVDLMVVFDTTGSMGGAIDEAKVAALDLADLVLGGLHGRIGLVQFRDAGDSPEVELVRGLSSDADDFSSGLATLQANGGGDTPEAQLAGILTALNGVDWKAGATKIVTVITDAPGKDPDPITGATMADVVQRANEIDPVGVFGVDACGFCGVAEWMQPLADGTGGAVINGTGGVARAFQDVIDQAGARPVVQLQDTTYTEPGVPVTFSVEGTYDPDSIITGYRWDLDGDGDFEVATPEPTVTTTYDAPGTLTVAALAEADDGGTGAATTTLVVQAGWRDQLTPGAPQQPDVREVGTGSVAVGWQPPAGGVTPTGYAIFDRGDAPIAFASADTRAVTIDGLAPGSEQHFSIRAVASGLQGAAAATRSLVLSRPPSGGPALLPAPLPGPIARPRVKRVGARLLAGRTRLDGRRLKIRILCPRTAPSPCRVTLSARVGRAAPFVDGRRLRIRPGVVSTTTLRLPLEPGGALPARVRVALSTSTSAGVKRGTTSLRRLSRFEQPAPRRHARRSRP